MMTKAISTKPVGQNCIVLVQRPEDRSRGGIILPDGARRAPNRGVVVAIGESDVVHDGVSRPLGFGPGDAVLFSRIAGLPIEIDGAEEDCEYRLIAYYEVLAKIEQ